MMHFFYSSQYKKIFNESKGNLYGSQLEIAFLEMLKTNEFKNIDIRASVIETEPIPELQKEPLPELEKEEEDTPPPAPAPAPRLSKMDRRFSQIMIVKDDLDSPEEKPKDEIKENINKNKILFVDAFEITRNRNAFKFLVAIDGSNESEAAVQVAMSLRKPSDHIELLHIYSDNEQLDSGRLPKLFRQKAVHTKYDTMITTLPISRDHYSFSWIRKDNDTSSREVLLDHLKKDIKEYHAKLEDAKKLEFAEVAYNTNGDSNNKSNKNDSAKVTFASDNTKVIDNFDNVSILEKCKHPVDFVVIGHIGRKAALRHEKMLTAVVDLALHDIKTSVIFVNQPPRIPATTSSNTSTVIKKVFMAVNESDCSKKGLKMLLTLVHSQDTLILIYVNQENTVSDSTQLFDKYNHNKLREIQSYYEKELALFGPINSSFIVLNNLQYQDTEKPDAPIRRLPVGSMSLSFKSNLVGNYEEELEQATSRVSARLHTSRSNVSARVLSTPRTLPSLPASNELNSSTTTTRIPFGLNLSSSKALGYENNSLTSSGGHGHGESIRSSRGYGDSMSSRGFGGDAIRSSRGFGESTSKKYLGSSKSYAYEAEGETDNEDTFEPMRTLNLNSTAKVIIDYINVKQAESPPDFFAIAPRPRGLGDSTVGLMTEAIISQLDCNIIICKH